jgi:hypothetical protein
MPGSRDRNLRSGDLSEGFGLELLRQLAFVAPVPRPEDVGVDAVATLFRREGRALLAEDSFFVQIKTASVRTVVFEGDELNWLRMLKLPIFFLSVNVEQASLELRSIARAMEHPNFFDRRCIEMQFDRPTSAFPDITNDKLVVWLGPPILQWKFSDAVEDGFQQMAYLVLKGWINVSMQCIGQLAIGMHRQINWETNRPPEISDAYAIMHGKKDLIDRLTVIRPYIQNLQVMMSMQLYTSPASPHKDDLLRSIKTIYEFMRANGVDPDPGGYGLAGWWFAANSRQQQK